MIYSYKPHTHYYPRDSFKKRAAKIAEISLSICVILASFAIVLDTVWLMDQCDLFNDQTGVPMIRDACLGSGY